MAEEKKFPKQETQCMAEEKKFPCGVRDKRIEYHSSIGVIKGDCVQTVMGLPPFPSAVFLLVPTLFSLSGVGTTCFHYVVVKIRQ
jgi:hypothetical protein